MNERRAQAALDRALDEKEDLLLLYQPIHDTETRRVVAAEALLRQRRHGGEIREASIITAAAEKGPELFVLDSMTMRKAFTDAAGWNGICLNVNLSPREFEDGGVIDRLRKLIDETGIDQRRINLEITETSYIDRPEDTLETLRQLRELGIGLWLDDFGTGHSTLVHLQSFPLDGLKIAGTFVRRATEDRRSAAIVRSLIALAHELEMRVVAEEIETQDQLELLADARCDYLQGFLLGRPMTIEEVTRSFAARAAPQERTDRDGDRDPS